MNEDIIKWAREAGFVIDEVAQQHQPNCIFHTHHMVDELLTRFAALVRADEREACAKVCENDKSQAMDWMGTARPGGHFADTIRARGHA
jgi:uncharacterized protein YfcZ (UPF0381/DUF406 family)